MRRLVVCDSHDASWLKAAAAEAKDGDTWDVLLLRVSAAAFEQRHEDALAALGNVRLLDVGQVAPRAALDVSRFVSELVQRLPSSDLGGRTLGERLRLGNRNLWWSLEITEKSAFRGPLIERLYGLALASETTRSTPYDGVWLQLGDAQLQSALAAIFSAPVRMLETPSAQPRGRGFAIAYWSRALAAVARFAGVRLVARLARWNVPQRLPGGLGIFTLFPYWWIDPFGPHASERFFSAPPGDRHPHYVAWVTWPWRLWRQRSALRSSPARTSVVPLQRMIDWRAAVRLLSPGLYRRIAQVRDAVRRHLAAKFREFDISTIVADEIESSLSDAELFFDALVREGIGNYLATVRPALLAYRVEGQPWEHALLEAAAARNVPVVGFFHSMFGDTYPALRFAAGEVAGKDFGAGQRPLPGRVLVPGTTAAAYLAADGFASDSIARCGPQRHASFVEFLRAREPRDVLRARLNVPVDVPLFFVALAIVEVETEGLFACLRQALGTAGGFHLLIKTHPNKPAGDASMHSAVTAIGSSRVSFVSPGGGMYEPMAAADCMVCLGSTVAFEAMALGVMPVVYEHPGTFPATSLRAFEDALFVVNSPQSMRAALNDVRRDGPETTRRRARWTATVDGVFGDLDTPLDDQMRHALARLSVTGLHTN